MKILKTVDLAGARTEVKCQRDAGALVFERYTLLRRGKIYGLRAANYFN